MARPAWNPPNPWLARHIEFSEPSQAPLEVLEEDARSALSRNDSPDLPFRWSLNPYRGCQHACSYCYARPTHQYLGFGAGTDFEKRIVVKRNLPEVLSRELASSKWAGEPITLSGVTDPYQPLEAKYELTRRCLEVCARFGNPVSIITKGVLAQRDAPLLAELHRKAGVRVFLSIPLADPIVARQIEPGAPTPRERLATMEALDAAGVPVGLALAPLIPGLGEVGMARLVEQAARAGARRAFMILLRLPGEVLPVFQAGLEATLPGRAGAVLSALTEMRGGHLQESRFGLRMGGSGERYGTIRGLFRLLCRKHGLSEGGDEELGSARMQQKPRQPSLFE